MKVCGVCPRRQKILGTALTVGVTISFSILTRFFLSWVLGNLGKGKVCIRANVAQQAGAYPSFCSMKRLGVFLLPLDGMLVHRRVTTQH